MGLGTGRTDTPAVPIGHMYCVCAHKLYEVLYVKCYIQAHVEDPFFLRVLNLSNTVVENILGPLVVNSGGRKYTVR